MVKIFLFNIQTTTSVYEEGVSRPDTIRRTTRFSLIWNLKNIDDDWEVQMRIKARTHLIG